MKPSMFIAPLAAFTIITAGAVSFAQTPPPAPQEHMQKMWNDLGLTDDQKEKLKAVHQEGRDMRHKDMEALKTLRQKMKEELLKPSPSKATLDGYATEMGNLSKRMTQARTDHLLKVKSILTPEQFSKLLDKEWMKPEMGEHFKGKAEKQCKGKQHGGDAASE